MSQTAAHRYRSAVWRWWWSVDRTTLAVLLTIIAIGFVLLLAAGPGAAARKGISGAFHFPLRQALFLAPAMVLMFITSMLTPLQARRAGVIICVGSILAMVLALLIGEPRNGAYRWLDFGPLMLQPSEFLKPGFVIAASWMLAEAARDRTFPGAAIGMVIYGISLALLVLQPDYGQAALLTAVWMIMFFIAGWSMKWLFGLFATACALITMGFYITPHLGDRIRGYLNPEIGDNYQVNMALKALASGGRTGKVLEPGSVKLSVPDAHTDFIFVVAGEQYGFLLCAFIIALFAAFVIRSFVLALKIKSVFAQTAICGLSAMIGLQAFINIGVSMRALPAKGMTLPFMSYGGSSLLAMALTVGFILALTRRHAPATRRREVMP